MLNLQADCVDVIDWGTSVEAILKVRDVPNVVVRVVGTDPREVFQFKAGGHYIVSFAPGDELEQPPAASTDPTAALPAAPVSDAGAIPVAATPTTDPTPIPAPASNNPA